MPHLRGSERRPPSAVPRDEELPGHRPRPTGAALPGHGPGSAAALALRGEARAGRRGGERGGEGTCTNGAAEEVEEAPRGAGSAEGPVVFGNEVGEAITCGSVRVQKKWGKS